MESGGWKAGDTREKGGEWGKNTKGDNEEGVREGGRKGAGGRRGGSAR